MLRKTEKYFVFVIKDGESEGQDFVGGDYDIISHINCLFEKKFIKLPDALNFAEQKGIEVIKYPCTCISSRIIQTQQEF